jgi:hypothetical protein
MDSMYVVDWMANARWTVFSIQFVEVVFNEIVGLQAKKYLSWLKNNFEMRKYTLFWISLENLPIEMQNRMRTFEIWRYTKAWNSISVHYQRRYIVVE